MSDQFSSKSFLPTFFGSLGAILIFAVIIFLAYLPHRPAPIDQAASEERQSKADEARAAGIAKINTYARTGDGRFQIPVDRAMELVVADYKK